MMKSCCWISLMRPCLLLLIYRFSSRAALSSMKCKWGERELNENSSAVHHWFSCVCPAAKNASFSHLVTMNEVAVSPGQKLDLAL